MGIRNSETLVKSEFSTDEKGNPTGGYTYLEGVTVLEDEGHGGIAAMEIHWQDGVIKEGQNGAFVEDVLEAARQRLLFFNSSSFKCRENSLAITKIEEALQWLDWRTRSRVIEGVENTYEKHTA